MSTVKEIRAEKMRLNKKVQQYKNNPYLAKIVGDIERYRPIKKKRERDERDKHIKLGGVVYQATREAFRETYSKLITNQNDTSMLTPNFKYIKDPNKPVKPVYTGFQN